jgi:sarcosine oxidase, subunit beta
VEAEYVVVGAGICGITAAWELARQGAEVVVLEAATVAAGASGGVGERGVRANCRDPRELPLARLAADWWPDLAAEADVRGAYRRSGHLQLIERAEDLAEALVVAERQLRHGIHTELVGRDQLRELEPEVSEGVVAALYCPDDGVADHTAVTTGLARAASRAGIEIREQAPVAGLERRGDRIERVALAGGATVRIGRALLVAANFGSCDLLRGVGTELPVGPVLPQVIVTPPLDTAPVRHLIGHAHRRLALKALRDGRVMVSGGWLGRWDPDAGVGRVDPEAVAGNLAEAAAVFPALDGAEVEVARADRTEAVTPDLIPVIDRIAGADNAFVATGWSGHGWAIAPAAGRLLVEWMRGGGQPPMLTPFTAGRFTARASAAGGRPPGRP